MPSTALITGATEGIGRALAFTLGEAGYRVGVCARTESKVRDLLAQLRAKGITAAGLPCDVGDEASVDRLTRHVVAELGPADTLINNAGIGVLKPLLELTTAEWDATMATNLQPVSGYPRRPAGDASAEAWNHRQRLQLRRCRNGRLPGQLSHRLRPG